VAVKVSVAVQSGKRQVEVTVAGDLDMSTAGVLRQTLRAHQGADEVLLDLTAVGFIDSNGIEVIVSAARALNGGVRERLRVCGAQAPVAHVFEVAGMAEILEPDLRPRG
jgi:anti-anti-sigma factor